jgi:hypothetical protein
MPKYEFLEKGFKVSTGERQANHSHVAEMVKLWLC